MKIKSKILKSLLIAGAVGIGLLTMTVGAQIAKAGAVNPGGDICDLNPNHSLTSYDLNISQTSYTYKVNQKALTDLKIIFKASSTMIEETSSCSSGALTTNRTTLTDWEIIVTDNDNYNSTIPGTYTFDVYGSYGSNTTSSHKVTVVVEEIDGTEPVIDGYQSTLETDVNDPITADSILDATIAIDNVDGEVDTYIKADNYTANMYVLGTYDLIIGAKDTTGNEATVTITITVKDFDAPVITGANLFESPMSSPLTLDAIKTQISVSDNYDENVILTIKSDGFTGNEQKLGSYTIKFYSADSSGNTSSDFVVTVNTKDDIAPTLTSTIENNLIQLTTSETISDDQVKNYLIPSDNASSVTTGKVEDTFVEYVPGTYIKTFKAVDAAGNYSEAITITIEVLDVEAPVIIVPGEFIIANKLLTETELVEIIAKINNIDLSVATYSVTRNEYVGNEEIPGEYAVAIAFTTDGETIEVEETIQVPEQETEAALLEEENKDYKDYLIWGGVGLLALMLLVIGVLVSKGSDNKKYKKRK